MALNVDGLPVDPNEFQAYLDELKFEQLPQLLEALQARFRELRSQNNPDEETVSTVQALASQAEAVRTEKAKRESASASARMSEAADAHRKAIADMEAQMFGTNGDPAPEGDTLVKDDDDDGGDGEKLATQFANIMAKALAKTDAIVASSTDLNSHIRNMPLSAIGRHTPDPKLASKRSEAVLVASADIPGVAKNGRVADITQLATLMGDRANMMTTTHGKPNYVNVAKLKREHKHRLNLDSTPEEVNDVLQLATNVEALVAAGGWCAPSEISYDFFNIVAEDGMLDLPTVGVLNRGGFRYPVSPSSASVFGSVGLWTWTEEDDISASAEPGPEKTCVRVPCPTFEEVRAACDGLCVTAGNLTDFAYPELITNYLRLIMAARAHTTNQSILAQLDAASVGVDIAGVDDEGAAAALLGYLELQAFDYREKYRMGVGSVLEVVLPNWAIGVIRHDLSNRNGVDLLAVTSAQVADWFNLRGLRVQFVSDWQSGFAADIIGDPVLAASAWPTTIDAMIYAPGTFVRGQALQLDLGVVRDSTLNATNDHTAAWMEDCYAVAQVGHESRLVTIPLCNMGVTGASSLVCAGTGNV
jgi:hypothetical protein